MNNTTGHAHDETAWLQLARRLQKQQLQQLARLGELASQLSALVHMLQCERGASNIFLCSGGQLYAAECRAGGALVDERLALFYAALERARAVAGSALYVSNTLDSSVDFQVGQTYTILHVDDSSSIRSLLLNLLNKEGRFKVEQRVNGQEAWDYLQSVRNRCEAENRPISDFLQGIITDIEMPAMDGLALCKRIKDDPVLKKLPVAIFSSMINESLARKCALVGADAQYTKPDLKALSVKLHELITTVWGHQGQSQSQNQNKAES